MGFELAIFEQQLDADYLEWLVDAHAQMVQEHFSHLWDYYANPMVPLAEGDAAERKAGASGRGYVQAQEYGLPARITGLARGLQGGVFGSRALRDIQRKEVVIENDIAWRVNAAADFLFGRSFSLISRFSIKNPSVLTLHRASPFLQVGSNLEGESRSNASRMEFR